MNIFVCCMALITWFLWVVISLPFLLVCVALTFLPQRIRHNRFYFTLSCLWGRLMMYGAGIAVHIEGTENLPSYPHQPSIITINHSSALDVPLGVAVAGAYPHMWITKKEYLKIPLFTFILSRMNFSVERANPHHALKVLLKVINTVQHHARHIILFPEGTRSTDEKINDFFSGFAMIAKRLERPVIPILFIGLSSIWPKKSFIINSFGKKVRVIIGKPLWCNPDESIEEFTQRVVRWYTVEIEKQSTT
jgi:1-acyl-sn-glycerol-3-phosphate acyltransferase